ncbi:MAG: hypothetical protein AB1461_17290 [Thermodesulfobacteriota bacterium]
MTHRNLHLELQDGAQPPAPSGVLPPVATLSFEAAGASWHGTLVEEPDEPTCRHPYDEESIVAQCRVNQSERSIVLTGEQPFTPIEVIVSMTKALHQSLFPNASGRWVFCRWESDHWPPASPLANVSVMLTHALGTRLTKSTVVVCGEQIGLVYFSAKEGL